MIVTLDTPTDRWARRLVCSKTGEAAPLDQPASLSPAGAPWLVDYELDPDRGKKLKSVLAYRPWSLWRYREVLPVESFSRRIDLGEGGTPLVHMDPAPDGPEVWVKNEAGNPTGSFKDRGLTLAVNRARELGAPGLELSSAGNAAISLAAYCAAAKLPCRVAVPTDAPKTVIERCRVYGAEVVVAGANLLEAATVLAERPSGHWNVATFREPYRVEGKKTMGYELAEQFDWRLPDWILYPTGGGTGLVGMAKAFDELERLGLIGSRRPRMVSVQMEGCAPIVRAFARGAATAEPWPDPHTSAWGLRVPKALADFLILKDLRRSNGAAVAVTETRTLELVSELARDHGLLVGPEGAACFAALERLEADGALAPGERVVLFQTGHPANYV